MFGSGLAGGVGKPMPPSIPTGVGPKPMPNRMPAVNTGAKTPGFMGRFRQNAPNLIRAGADFASRYAPKLPAVTGMRDAPFGGAGNGGGFQRAYQRAMPPPRDMSMPPVTPRTMPSPYERPSFYNRPTTMPNRYNFDEDLDRGPIDPNYVQTFF